MKKVALIVGAFAALGLGGSAIAGAASSQSTASTSSSKQQSRPAFPAHGSASHENAEKAVNGATAAKVRAAAVKSVGSGTAGEVTTDFTGKGYETTVTQSNGSKVEVHLDSSFNVMQDH